MMDALKDLVRCPLDFVPFAGGTLREKLNCTVRFIMLVCLAVAIANYDGFLGAVFVLIVGTLKACTSSAQLQSRPSALHPHVTRDGRVVDTAGCQLPTEQNPFGNFLLTDYDNPDRPPACRYEDVSDLVDEKFYKGLYRNANDLYETESSQRQFYQMPVTTVCNDRVGFARALFQDVEKPRPHGMR
jgi:hypothetical protein